MKFIILITLIMVSALNASVIEGRFDSSEMMKDFPDNADRKGMLVYQYERDDMLSAVISGIYDNEGIGNDTMAILFNRGMYEKITEMNPENYLQVYIIIQSLIKTDDFDRALVLCDSMLNFPDIEVRKAISTAKANILYKTGRYDEAMEIADMLDNDFGSYMKALIYFAGNETDKCIEQLNPISNSRIYEMKLLLLCEIYLNREEFNKVLEHSDAFEAQYKQSAHYFYIIYMRGLSYYRKGYFNKSIETLTEIAYNSKNSIIKGNAYYLIGKNYFMLGNYSEMEKYLGFVKNPRIESDYKKNALFLDGKGVFFSGEYSKAVNKLEQFITEYPEDFLTPYAYQLLAQAYFYTGKYDESLHYIGLIKDPEFIADKLVQMKYFIDYKEGLYADSITAYLDFLANEEKNPMRNEVFDFVIRNTDDDSLRSDLILNYMREFPDNEKLPEYYGMVMDYLLFTAEFTRVDDIIMSIKKNSAVKADSAMIRTVGTMFALNMYEEIINFYSLHIEDYSKLYSSVLFDVGRSLSKTDNENEEIVWTQLSGNFDDEYSDSAFVHLGGIYLEQQRKSDLDRLNESALSRNIYIQAEVKLLTGLYERQERQYERSVNTLIESAETFGDKRNRAASALIEAAESAKMMNEREYALLLLEKAELLATDVELLNMIKIRSAEY